MKRVVVGLSGGVDSSVTALLLQQQGYEVIGMFMRNWHDESVTISDDCPWIDDSNDALLVAQQLSIPFQVIDLSKEYKERIVDYMFSEYKAGRTPNPDVLCNREIKFDVFLKAAMELGADYVATGHYCRKIENSDGTFELGAGLDPNKDQSYFLCQLSQYQLSKALFPIGEMQKSEVRTIAKEHGIVTADKKDSQGLCFVGKIRLPDFLQQQLKPKKGIIVEVSEENSKIQNYKEIKIKKENLNLLTTPIQFCKEDGVKVAEHQGAHFYTIGQRKGLNIGGRPEPSFVISIDVENNIVFTGQTDEHSGLNRSALRMNKNEFHLISTKYSLSSLEGKEMDVRIRYRQPLQKGTIYSDDTFVYILFTKTQKGITPGQFCAIYDDGKLIASAPIVS